MRQIVVVVLDQAIDTMRAIVLSADHPARIGADHVALGKVPVGASAHVFVERWVPIVAIARVGADMSGETIEPFRTLAKALNSAAERSKIEAEFNAR